MNFSIEEAPNGILTSIAYQQQKTDGGVNEGVNSLFVLIGKNGGGRIPYYADLLESPVKTVERWVKQLRKEGKIEFRGAPKTGAYYIKK